MKNLVITYFLQQKNVKGYFILYVLAAILLSCLSVFYFSSGVMFWLMKVVQLLTFIGLGIVHTMMIERGLPFIEDKFESKLSFSALLTGFICVALLVFYFFSNRSMLFMALASSCAFFIPYTVRQSWKVYKWIPESHPLIWFGFTDKLDPPDIVYLSSIPVIFKLSVLPHDKTALSFSIKAPLPMELSRLFNLFVLAAEKNYDIRIDAVDEKNRFYGWQFFAEHLNGLLNIQLDPEISVGSNNKIKPDTVIFVKRVQAGAYKLPLKEADGSIH